MKGLGWGGDRGPKRNQSHVSLLQGGKGRFEDTEEGHVTLKRDAMLLALTMEEEP